MKSMTGFGRSEGSWKGRQYRVEIKTLNSKQLDLSLRIPAFLRERDLQIRTMVGQALVRGKVDVAVFCDDSSRELKTGLNTSVMQAYYNQLKEFCEQNEISNPDILTAVMSLPEVVLSDTATLEEEEWGLIAAVIVEALDKVDEYRLREGAAQYKVFMDTIKAILSQREMLISMVDARNARIRSRIEQGLKDLLLADRTDQNRIEQEIILYVERWDIAEELQRLMQNCTHFEEEISNESRGRTLGFIAQEIGREINTIGSKANDFEIQKSVVAMKESLEQVKEQLANVL